MPALSACPSLVAPSAIASVTSLRMLSVSCPFFEHAQGTSALAAWLLRAALSSVTANARHAPSRRRQLGRVRRLARERTWTWLRLSPLTCHHRCPRRRRRCGGASPGRFQRAGLSEVRRQEKRRAGEQRGEEGGHPSRARPLLTRGGVARRWQRAPRENVRGEGRSRGRCIATNAPTQAVVQIDVFRK